MPTKKIQVVYKLAGINAEDGVDIFEIAPVLMHFGELIRSANTVLGGDQKIDIKVKPFRQGSWITDFVIQHASSAQALLDLLKTSNGQDLMLLMAFLGLNVKDGVVGVATIIRFTHGKVSSFFKNESGDTVTYVSPTGENLTVSMAEHRLVQSPLIQNNYYGCVIAPLEKFPTAEAVVIESNDPDYKEQIFTDADRDFFREYSNSELLEDLEDNISSLSGIYLKPKRGSYSGEEKAYSFIMGDGNVLWPVTIVDQIFLGRLTSGEIRLYAEDALKVDLEIRQKRDLANKVATTYSITKVLEYYKYEKPKQLGLGGLG